MPGGDGLSPGAGRAAPRSLCAGPAFSPRAALLRGLSGFPQFFCSTVVLCWFGDGLSVGGFCFADGHVYWFIRGGTVRIGLFSAHPQARQPSVTLFRDDLLSSFLRSSDVSVQ